jgi:hypothetical protein
MNCGSIKIMVIYKDLFWGTSRDPVGFKNFVDFDIMVVACPLQDCCCISVVIMMLFIFQFRYVQAVLLLWLFLFLGNWLLCNTVLRQVSIL